MQPRELKKLYILFFLVLVTLSALVLRPIQKEIFTRSELLKDQYLQKLEILLGKSITYSSMGPSVFCRIDIHDFKMVKQAEFIDEQAIFADFVPDVSAKRVRVGFSLLELLKFDGNSVIHSIKSIKFDYPLVEYNTEKDFFDYFSPKAEPEVRAIDVLKTIAVHLPDDFALRLKNGTARMNSSDAKFTFGSFNARGRVGNDKIFLKTRWTVDASFPKAFNSPIKLAIPGKMNLIFDGNTGELEGALAINKLETDFITLNAAKIRAKISRNGVFIQNTDKQNGYDIDFTYNATENTIKTNAKFKNFAPSTLVSFPGTGDFVNTLLKSRISGSAELNFDAEKKLSYKTDITGNFPESGIIGQGTFGLAASGNEHEVNFRNLNFDILSRGRAQWAGAFNIDRLEPRGNLILDDFIFTKTADKTASSGISGDIFVSSGINNNIIYIFADTLTIGDTELQAFNIEILRSLARFDLSLSAIRFTNTENFGDAEIGRIEADASLIMPDEKSNTELEVRLELERFALSDSLEILRGGIEVPKTTGPLKMIENDIVMTTEVFLTTDFNQTLFNIPRLVTALKHNSGMWATYAISGTDRRFDLTESHFVYPGGTVDVQGFADYSNVNNVRFSTDIFALENTYFFEGTMLDRKALSISSDSGVKAALNLGEGGAFSGFLITNDLHLPQQNQMLALDIESDFRYESPDFWSVNFDKIVLSNYNEVYSSEPIMEINGRADQSGAVFDRLFFDNWRGPLAGGADFKWDSFRGKRLEEVPMSGLINLTSSTNDEFINLEINNDENSFLAWAQVENFQMGRFVDSYADIKINGEMGFFKRPDEVWSSAFDISSISGTFAGSKLQLSTQGTFDETGLEMSETNISFGSMRAQIPALHVSLNRQNLQTAASINGTGFGSPISAEIAVNAQYEGRASWLSLRNAFESISGNITFNNLRFSNYMPDEPFSFDFSRREKSLSITGGPEDMLRVKIDDSGDFFAGLSYPSPVRFTVVGLINNNFIDAQTSNFYADLQTLWKYIPVEAVKFSGGFINANVRVTGQLNDPAFYGNAWANSIRMSIPDFVDGEIGPTPARAEFDGNEIRLLPIFTRVGKGECSISGNFRVSQWVPRDFGISINVPKNGFVPVSMNVAGFLASGRAAGNMLLEFSENALRISGEVLCDEAEMSMSFGEENEENQDSEKKALAVQTDLTIISGRKVEFLWPNTNFPILRATAAAGDKLYISSDSLSGHLSLVGDINIKSGELFYFQRSFYIRSGSLHFNESEIQFDPRITARAETRDRANNEAVTISMVIDNQPIRDFTPRLESNPPLSQIEILSMMGEKFSGSAGADNVIERAFLSSTADILAQFGVVRRVERTLRDWLHVDMFSFRTQAIQNAILLNVFNNSTQADSANTSAGVRSQSSMDNTRIGNYFDNTTVFIGKYIGTDMFVQGMVSFRYDPARMNMGGVSIEPEISTEFKTPLFDIKWELITKNLSTRWVLNNNITLSKKWTLP